MKRYAKTAAALFLGLSMTMGSVLPVQAEELYEGTVGYTWFGDTYVNTEVGLSFDIPEDFTIETFTYYGETDRSCTEIDATQEDTLEKFTFESFDLSGQSMDIEEFLTNYRNGFEAGAEMELSEGTLDEVMLGNDSYTVLTCEPTDNAADAVVQIYGRITEEEQAYVFLTYWFGENHEGIDSIMASMKPAEAGVLFDRLYVNTALGLSINIPGAYMITHTIGYDSLTPHTLAALNEDDGSSFMMAAADTAFLAEEYGVEADQNELLALMKEDLLGDMGDVVGEVTDSELTIGDVTYAVSAIDVVDEAEPGEIALLCHVKEDTAYIMVASYLDAASENMEMLISSMASTEEGFWDGNTYINGELGWRMEVPETLDIELMEPVSDEEHPLFQLMAPDTGENLIMTAFDIGLLEEQGYTEAMILENIIDGATMVETITDVTVEPTEWYYYEDLSYAPVSYTMVTLTSGDIPLCMELLGRRVDDTFYVMVFSYSAATGDYLMECFDDICNIGLETEDDADDTDDMDDAA